MISPSTFSSETSYQMYLDDIASEMDALKEQIIKALSRIPSDAAIWEGIKALIEADEAEEEA